MARIVAEHDFVSKSLLEHEQPLLPMSQARESADSSMKYPVLLLSRDDIMKAGLEMDEIIRIVESTFRAHGEGKVIMPAKSVLPFDGERKGHLNAMPAYVEKLNVAGIKWTSGYPPNRQKGIPTCFDILVLTDAEIGAPFAILEGTWITSARTAAATAVGIKHLAKKGSKVVGMVGAGDVALSHVEAISRILRFDEFKITDINKKACETLVKEAAKRFGLHLKQVDNAYEAASNSDVIVTITRNHGERFLDNEWVKKGTLVAAIGGPNEVQPELAKSVKKIIVDNRQQCASRGNIGGLIRTGVLRESDVYAEFGEVVAGSKKGRETDDERIIFAPIGMGTNDVAVGHRAYQLAKEKGLGKIFHFTHA
ncbi:MAG: ornithine cyclodeaminase family protein [Candidatus Bathyarchaeia archaeon]|jgi:alanine dehydrogenase